MQRAALHHLVVTLAQLGVALVNHLLSAPAASRRAVAVAVVIMVILIFLVRLEEEDLQALELILKAVTCRFLSPVGRVVLLLYNMEMEEQA
jgi:hypothetical protein